MAVNKLENCELDVEYVYFYQISLKLLNFRVACRTAQILLFTNRLDYSPSATLWLSTRLSFLDACETCEGCSRVPSTSNSGWSECGCILCVLTYMYIHIRSCVYNHNLVCINSALFHNICEESSIALYLRVLSQFTPVHNKMRVEVVRSIRHDLQCATATDSVQHVA